MSTRRNTSVSIGRPPSISSRASLSRRISTLSSASVAEAGTRQDAAAAQADASISEEIEEIKRYEDFTTIDWIQDAARASQRRNARSYSKAGWIERKGKLGFRWWLRDAWNSGMAWVVVSLVGFFIGINSAFLNIVTEWLSDIKLGYCTRAFYLNEQFCCWGAEAGCDEWKRWSSFALVNYVLYTGFAVLFAFTSARLVKSFAPYAAGSGISEIKCIIAGFVMKGFLGFTTLVIKSIGLPLSIASGLSVGKEGPSVHFAVCIGNVVSRMFPKYERNAAKTREILSASAAAGVGVAFGSPIGGVLFSMEEMSNYFPLKTMWRSYFCALVATAFLAAMNPFRTGQLVMFSVRYDRGWHFFEIPFYILLGIFGGLYGAFVIKWHLRVQTFRKKYLTNFPVLEAVVLAALTAVVCYPNMFLRIDMTELMEHVFAECEGDEDYNGLCERKNRLTMILSLAIATLLRTILVCLSYGCKVPAGIFVPSMAIGSTFGRMIGICVQALHEAFPDSKFFSACGPDGPCITPGTYAFLGAGAALSGIMHITVSVVVIMFELTGALTYILPTMIVVGVTKAVSDRFGKGGIADRMIWFNGFPFLDSKEEHTFGVSVTAVMTSNVTVLPAQGLEFGDVERIMAENQFQGYPIVEDLQSRILVGYIGRTELRYAMDRARREHTASPRAKCSFSPPKSLPPQTPSANGPAVTFDTLAATASQMNVDFRRFVDPTPLAVHPQLALETVMEMFKKMGPRVILVEHRGKMVGLVTVKDCLKYQFKVEHQEHSAAHDTDNTTDEQSQRDEKIWQTIVRVARWLKDKTGSLSHATGRLRLNSTDHSPISPSARVGAARGTAVQAHSDTREDELELQDRRDS